MMYSLSVDSTCTLIGRNGVFTQEYVDMVVGSQLICLELFLTKIFHKRSQGFFPGLQILLKISERAGQLERVLEPKTQSRFITSSLLVKAKPLFKLCTCE